MGMMSRARVLGYRYCRSADGSIYLYLPASRRRRRRRLLAMGQWTERSASLVHTGPKSQWAAVDPEFLARLPALYEFLAEQMTAEGFPRVTSTLQVSCEDSLWKVALTDRAQKGGTFDYKLWRSGDTLFNALEALDAALQSGTADWRKFPKWVAPRRS